MEMKRTLPYLALLALGVLLVVGIALAVSRCAAGGAQVAAPTATRARAAPPGSTPSPPPTPNEAGCVPPADWVPYTVQPGETWYGLAERYHMTIETLQRANCLAAAATLQAGQTVVVPYIPPSPTPCVPPAGWVIYTVQADETLYSIGLRYGMTAEQLRQADCLPSAELIEAGQQIYVPYIPPTATATSPAVIELPTVIAPPAAGQAPAAGSAPPAAGEQPAEGAPPAGGGAPPAQPPSGGPALKAEIYLSTGGEQLLCPKVVITERWADGSYKLCAYGFVTAEEISMRLQSPDGSLVFTKTAKIQAGTCISATSLWFPIGLPTGTWTASLEADSDEYQEFKFDVRLLEQAAINVVPEGDINPFETKPCGQLLSDNAIIRGAKFDPNQDVTLGIYYATDKKDKGRAILSLIRTKTARTNEQGAFATVVHVEPTDQAGKYWVIAVTDINAESTSVVDPKAQCYVVP